MSGPNGFLLDFVRRTKLVSEKPIHGVSRIWAATRNTEVHRFRITEEAWDKIVRLHRENDGLYQSLRHLARPPFVNTYVEFDSPTLGQRIGYLRLADRGYIAAWVYGSDDHTLRFQSEHVVISPETMSVVPSPYTPKDHLRETTQLFLTSFATLELLWLLMASGKGSIRLHEHETSGSDPAPGKLRWAAHTEVHIDLSPKNMAKQIRRAFRTKLRAPVAEHHRRGNWCRFSWKPNCEHDWGREQFDDTGWMFRKDCLKCGSILRWRKDTVAGKDRTKTKFHDYRVKG